MARRARSPQVWSCVDASLDARFGYSEVLARATGARGILDLLTVNLSGRLAIL